MTGFNRFKVTSNIHIKIKNENKALIFGLKVILLKYFLDDPLQIKKV